MLVCIAKRRMVRYLFYLNLTVYSGIDSGLTFLCFTIFVISLCKARMKSKGAYIYFCYCELLIYDFVGFMDCFAASRIFQNFVESLSTRSACTAFAIFLAFYLRTY